LSEVQIDFFDERHVTFERLEETALLILLIGPRAI